MGTNEGYRVKTIAMYLPQFHRTPENDEWWGEGYTEWTAVKTAESLFEGHTQPRTPLNNNYYNLLDKESLLWQADLADKYHVDGFCFYHYYFKDGRKILEKPAENLLEWKDVNMKYCFCWANETWARTWNRFGGTNSWSDRFERGEQNDDLGILLEQQYGREEEWREHFEYLLPFFKDPRYIRNENGNPIFLIHRPTDITCIDEMIEYWKLLAKENNIEPPFIIGSNVKYKMSGLDAILINGPASYFDNCKKEKKNNVTIYDYEEVWKNAISKQPINGITTYFGAFQNYDDTPRRGKKGTILMNPSPEIFKKYFLQLVKKNQEIGNEFLFINAWNEWGEGMYLEPDENNQYDYLEALSKSMLETENDVENNFSKQDNNNLIQIEYLEREVEKFKANYFLLDKWMFLREKNKNVSEYIKLKGYGRIAIYGFSAIGKHLYVELQGKGIDIKYILDQDKTIKFENVEIADIKEIKDDIDAIIVTAVFYYDEIRKNLCSKVNCPIISLEEIIRDMI